MGKWCKEMKRFGKKFYIKLAKLFGESGTPHSLLDPLFSIYAT